MDTRQGHRRAAAALRTGAALLSMLLATAGIVHAEDIRVTPSRDRSFRVPFQVPAGERRLREVQLWVSDNQGQSWREAGRAAPEQGYFSQFTAVQDGLYWFAVRTVDQQGNI